MRRCFLLFALISLVHCSTEKLDIPPQQWQDFWVKVETRPSVPTPGMNEFIVILTDARRRPVSDVVVSLNTRGDWKQAIPDGHVGVFRRALAIRDPQRDVLKIKLKRQGKEKILQFALFSNQAK